jgi:alcohol dehydrogenase
MSPLLGPSPRAKGVVRSTLSLLTPMLPATGRIASERGRELRVSRLRSAAADRVRERVRPTRPTMRGLILRHGAQMRWESVPAPPPPGPHGAIVRPLAIATCDMDRPMALGRTPFPLPLHFGHECVAEVLRTGGAVENVRPGDRVVVPFQISCGRCAACRAGRTGNCLAVPPISMYGFGVAGGHWGGAFADELAVPFADGMLVPLPSGVEPAAAASVADNVSDAYRHIAPHLPRLLAQDPSAEVLILGAPRRRVTFTPSVGLYAGQIARALGARTVTYVDARPGALDHARRLGLNALTPGDLRGREPAPLVVDISTEPAGHRLAIACTAADGTCSCAGTLHASVRLPMGAMYGRNATLHVGRAHARALIPEVLALMADGRLRPEDVTTVQAPLDDAPAALATHVGGDSIKTVLVA